jgi:hypothetical protein
VDQLVDEVLMSLEYRHEASVPLPVPDPDPPLGARARKEWHRGW